MGISRYWVGLPVEYKSSGKLRTGIIERVSRKGEDFYTYEIKADHSGMLVLRTEKQLWRLTTN